MGLEEHDHEGRVITLDMGDFYLLTVYTPNAQRELTRLDYRMQWEDAFLPLPARSWKQKSPWCSAVT